MGKREEVLHEFGTAECVKRDDCTHFDCVAERKMADEIVRLRTDLTTAERERDEARRERDRERMERAAMEMMADDAVAERDKFASMLHDCENERDEARAAIGTLRELVGCRSRNVGDVDMPTHTREIMEAVRHRAERAERVVTEATGEAVAWDRERLLMVLSEVVARWSMAGDDYRGRQEAYAWGVNALTLAHPAPPCWPSRRGGKYERFRERSGEGGAGRHRQDDSGRLAGEAELCGAHRNRPAAVAREGESMTRPSWIDRITSPPCRVCVFFIPAATDSRPTVGHCTGARSPHANTIVAATHSCAQHYQDS